MRSMIFLLGAAMVLASLPATSARAQQVSGADYLAAMRACASETDRDRKLACYERAAGALVTAVEGGEIRLVDRQERENTRRGLFGFNIGRLFGGGDGEKDRDELAEMETLVSTITEVRQIDRKTYVFRIAEANAQWQINEAPSRFITPRVGEKVEFKKAALGSYFIRVGKQIGVRGKRIG